MSQAVFATSNKNHSQFTPVWSFLTLDQKSSNHLRRLYWKRLNPTC